MGSVILEITASLDGFITGPNDSVDQPLGEGGERLHDWIFGGQDERSGTAPRGSATGANRRILDEMFATMGAVVMRRRWFDHGERPWGDNPPFQVPVFVLTHRARETLVKGATSFTFVPDGIESAVRQARAARGGKNVVVGGAETARPCLKAGLLDEVHLHMALMFLGRGGRLFENLDGAHVKLAPIRVIEAPDVTHLQYRVIR